MVSSDIYNTTTKYVIEDEGSGHRAIVTNTSIKNQNGQKKVQYNFWNFKKAKWKDFQDAVELDIEKIDTGKQGRP